MIVLYTDGVVEGSKDGLDGLHRLREAVAKLEETPDEDAATALLKATKPTPRDDAAMLVIHIAPPIDASPPMSP